MCLHNTWNFGLNKYVIHCPGKIDKKHVASGLNNLLLKTGFIKLDILIEATAADDETKHNLEKIKQMCIDKHKHRDEKINAGINYSMMRNGKYVNSIMVYKDGTDIPAYWLSNKELALFIMLLVIGLPVVGNESDHF